MTTFSLRWKIHKPLTVFALLVLPLLLSLGAWQLRRADEKRELQAAFALQQSAAPLALSDLPAQPEQYARVHLRGHYDNERSFLLDNRVYQGRFGYEVVTAFQPTGSSKMVLVNRGWVEGDPARRQRPRVAAVDGEVVIMGAVYRDTARFHFVDNAHERDWPKLIQNLRIEDLQQQLERPALPFIVRLDPESPGAYRIDWQIVPAGFGPEKHIAYAVTWFSLAVALVIIWLVSSSNITQLLMRNSHGD